MSANIWASWIDSILPHIPVPNGNDNVEDGGKVQSFVTLSDTSRIVSDQRDKVGNIG